MLTQQWTSNDPSADRDDWNLRRYCKNDPINNIDPSGLQEQKPASAPLSDEELEFRMREFWFVRPTEPKDWGWFSEVTLKSNRKFAGLTLTREEVKNRIYPIYLKARRTGPDDKAQFRMLHALEEAETFSQIQERRRKDQEHANQIAPVGVLFRTTSGQQHWVGIITQQEADHIQRLIDSGSLHSDSREETVNQIAAAIGLIGDAIQATVAVAWIYETGGIGAWAGGTWLLARATDSAGANLQTLADGSPHDTLLVQALTSFYASNPDIDEENARKRAKRVDYALSAFDLVLGFKAAGGNFISFQRGERAIVSFAAKPVGGPQLATSGAKLELAVEVSGTIYVSAKEAAYLGIPALLKAAGNTGGTLVFMTAKSPKQPARERPGVETGKDKEAFDAGMNIIFGPDKSSPLWWMTDAELAKEIAKTPADRIRGSYASNLRYVQYRKSGGKEVYSKWFDPISAGSVAPRTGATAPNFNELPESVLARIQRGDHKGRPFGTPRNPRMPTVEEFNPRVREVRAGDLEATIRSRMHPENPQQAGPVSQLSNEELARCRLEDPISGVEGQGGLGLTGGHHRTAEIIRRVQAGQMSPDTIIRIVVHD
jgi:hypothetical protein